MLREVINIILLIFSFNASASIVKMGAIYPILELDALLEIEMKSSKVSWDKIFNQDYKKWSAILPFNLPTTREKKNRIFVPWYSIPFDISDPKGNIIYPKGFNFNPLQYIKIPQRIIVTSSKHISFMKPKLKFNDLILLTEGDVVEVSNKLDRPVFILDKEIKNRLGINYEPSIIVQREFHLLIEELCPSDEKNSNE